MLHLDGGGQTWTGGGLPSPAMLRATTWPKLGKAWALAEEKDNLGTSFIFF